MVAFSLTPTTRCSMVLIVDSYTVFQVMAILPLPLIVHRFPCVAKPTHQGCEVRLAISRAVDTVRTSARNAAAQPPSTVNKDTNRPEPSDESKIRASQC